MPRHDPRSDNAHNDVRRGDNKRGDRSRSERISSATQDAMFGEVGASNVTAGLRIQKEMLGLLSDIGQDWFTRAAAEAELALRLPNRLTAARSLPDAFTAYQEWFSEWMNRCSEDSQRLLSDGQKIMVTGTRCFTGKQSAPAG